MDGALALMAGLAAFGGRWLRAGGSAAPPDLMSGNSCFQYVGVFTAEVPRRGLWRAPTSADSPEKWLAGLRSAGVANLRLVTDLHLGGELPPHIASSFANSGTSGLLATAKRESTLWSIRWDVGNREAKDRRIWSLTAQPHPAATVTATSISVEESRDRVTTALVAIADFASQHSGMGNWVQWFEKAQALLSTPEPTPPYHADMLPADASLDRRQLAAAAIQSWVFGGMGSWNDNGFRDPTAQTEYDRVSADLYSVLLQAIAVAANGA